MADKKKDGVQTGGGGQNPSKSPTSQRKRTKLGSTEKKIAEDEFMAAAIGDVEWLRQSLRGTRGAINFDKNGLAPIHLAAIHGRLDCLKLLIEKFKVNVNLPSSTGWRPIHLVISNQTGKRAYNCLVYLISQGADPSVTNDDGISPVHQASSEGHVQCLKLLIEVGASIVGVDSRGHTPMDLAKLWGHRKCARILAAEQWHQEKDYLAGEMKQLQKLKMQEVLKEMEEEEEIKADQQFYGEIAFNEWLQKHGYAPNSTGPSSGRNEQQKPQGQNITKKKAADARKGAQETEKDTQKPNSIRPKPAVKEKPLPTLEEQSQSSAPNTPGRTQIATKLDAASSRSLSGSFVKDRSNVGQPEDQSTIHCNSNLQMTEEKDEGFYNPTPWNKSTKVEESKYQPILPDQYPRDEFTMLPITAPKRERSTLSAVLTGESRRRDSKKSVKMPSLPKDVIDKALAKDSRQKTRTVVYKCKNVIDVQCKKHYDRDIVPPTEAGIHMCNDLTSQLFRAGLLVNVVPGTPSTVLSSLSNWSDKPEVQGLGDCVKRMSKPTHFPNIKGEEYDLNTRQVAH